MRFPLKLKVLLRTANFFWVDFCSTTGIRGFSFITKSIFRVESYFWLILVVICAYLTLIDVRNTIQLYMMEPTITKVIVMNNNSISLGSPTVCIDLNIENMKFGPVDLLQPETVRKFIRKFSQKHQSLSGYLNDTFNWLKTFEPTDLELVRKVPQFSYKSFNNSELDLVENELMPALSLAVSVVSGIVRVEQLVRLDYSLVQLNWGIRKKSVDPSYETDYIDGKTSEAVGVFYNFILSKGESFDQILHLSGALMCEMMQLQIVTTERNATNGQLIPFGFSPCLPSSVSWLGIAPFSDIGLAVLCLKLNLPSSALTFGDPEQTSYIFINTNRILSGEEDFNNLVRLDLSGSPVITVNSEGLHTIRFKEQQAILLNIVGHYMETSTKSDRCSNESKLICRLKCRSAFIQSKCNCIPLSFVNPDSSMDEIHCGKTLFTDDNQTLGSMGFVRNFTTDCLQMKVLFDPDERCSNSCLKNCESKLYSSVFYPPFIRNRVDDTVILLLVNQFVYPFTFEVPQMDLRSFMSVLGGNLSFWFGASFLVLVHVIVFCTRIPLQYLQVRNKFAKARKLSRKISHGNSEAVFQFEQFLESDKLRDLIVAVNKEMKGATKLTETDKF